MTVTEFIEKLRQNPAEIEFSNTMKVIEAYYTFQETKFTNGELINEAGQNSGSCKLFAFAKLHGFSKEETLHCFGAYYQDVLNSPDGNDHPNIRNFIKTGWNGIVFENEALQSKNML